MAFTEDEAAYLKSQPLARVATVDPDGQPDVTPVSFEFDGTHFYLGCWAPEQTRSRLSARTSGATSKLSMIASASGISTDRPRYKSARMIPAVMMRLL